MTRYSETVELPRERPLEQRRTSGGKELQPVAPLAFGVRAFSALPRHFLRSWTTDEASRVTGAPSSKKVPRGWGSSYRPPPRAEMPSGPVLLPSTPFPPLVLRCSSGRTAARPMIPPLHPLQMRPDAILLADRKSTRLNSSHLGISYAVFCL